MNLRSNANNSEDLKKVSASKKFDREKHIKAEMRMYKNMFADAPKDRQDVVNRLCKEAAFMSATLRELQIRIEEEGPIGTFVNGNGFEITQENPAQVSYNKMIKNYTTTVKSIMAEMPKNEKTVGEEDELMAFLKEHRK